MPLLNDVIVKALARHRAGLVDHSCGPQAAVLITDWSEIARNVWFPRKGEYHAICGTEVSVAQARRVPALNDQRVHPMNGLLIRPDFANAITRAAARETLALDPARPIVTILYGAQGSERMLSLARTLAQAPPTAQIVFMCGRNAALADALRAENLPYTVQIVEFTDQVPAYLAASALFVGKPGPGSVSEALAFGLPILLDRRMVLPQEKSVIDHVVSQRYGQAFSSMKEFRRAFDDLLCGQTAGQTYQKPEPNRSAEQIADILGLIHAGPFASSDRTE
jgi:1,2-diacylglycerol 3-beta-galactosyltransferase